MTHIEKSKPAGIEIKPSDRVKKMATEKAEQLGILILNEENIDEILGDKPYLSHTIVTNPEKLIRILEAGELQSSKKSGSAAMTYESDRLIGMDTNVFFALGKGYMRKDTYSLIFDPEILAKMPDASFVEDDLMKIEGEIIREFLEEHSEEIVMVINQKRGVLKETFEKKVNRIFQGGYGIYHQYFGEHARDRTQDFLEAIKLKRFKGIDTEKEVIDQFTILSDVILSEEIMPPKLRDELKKLLQEKVIKPHTVMGTKNIQDAISRCWKADDSLYKRFLPDDRHVPEKVVELRVADEVEIKNAIIAIYMPINKINTKTFRFIETPQNTIRKLNIHFKY